MYISKQQPFGKSYYLHLKLSLNVKGVSLLFSGWLTCFNELLSDIGKCRNYFTLQFLYYN